MYVYSKNSRIFHNELCGCVKRISPQNRRFTGTANPASELGLMHCKFCAPIVRQMKKEKEELLPYAAQNGLAYFYQRGDNTMVIMTPHAAMPSRIVDSIICSLTILWIKTSFFS